MVKASTDESQTMRLISTTIFIVGGSTSAAEADCQQSNCAALKRFSTPSCPEETFIKLQNPITSGMTEQME
jgi:hypothetical protein